MDDFFDSRLKEMALYVIDTGSTVRETARVFGVSKSTVHKELTKVLKEAYPSLYGSVENVLNKNSIVFLLLTADFVLWFLEKIYLIC